MNMRILSTDLLHRKEYVAGSESVVLNQQLSLTLVNGDKLTFCLNCISFHELENLEAQLTDEASIASVVTASRLTRSALLGLYRNEDGLRTCYTLIRSTAQYLIIFSFGELQPAHYALQLESIWLISD